MRKLLIMTLVLSLMGLTNGVPSLSASKPSTWYRDQVAVVMWHHIHDLAQSGDTITTQLFKDQLKYLRDQGYQFITLQQFKAYLAGSSVPDNAVLVTFDDGYESFYENAYPTLKKMRIPAVNFVITKDLENPLASYIPSLSKDEIIEMTHDTNFIDAQCHTNAMHTKTANGEAPLTTELTINGKKESEQQYEARVLADTKTCIDDLRVLYPATIDSLAYPFGIYDKLAATILHEGGIDYAFTIVPEMTTRNVDRLQIPRINAGAPWITPEGLHNTIIRHVVSVNHPFSDVNLKEVVEQLGGQLTQDKDGTIHMQYRGKAWTGKLNSNRVTGPVGTVNTLGKSIVLKNGHLSINLDDMEKLLGVTIVYNPNIKKFSTRRTPNAAK